MKFEEMYKEIFTCDKIVSYTTHGDNSFSIGINVLVPKKNPSSQYILNFYSNENSDILINKPLVLRFMNNPEKLMNKINTAIDTLPIYCSKFVVYPTRIRFAVDAILEYYNGFNNYKLSHDIKFSYNPTAKTFKIENDDVVFFDKEKLSLLSTQSYLINYNHRWMRKQIEKSIGSDKYALYEANGTIENILLNYVDMANDLLLNDYVQDLFNILKRNEKLYIGFIYPIDDNDNDKMIQIRIKDYEIEDAMRRSTTGFNSFTQEEKVEVFFNMCILKYDHDAAERFVRSERYATSSILYDANLSNTCDLLSINDLNVGTIEKFKLHNSVLNTIMSKLCYMIAKDAILNNN